MRTTSALTLQSAWPGLKQAFELTRERTVAGRRTVEVVYGVTSLPEDHADAARLLELTRQHWRIENRLHYVRDVTLGEDACRVRKGAAPQILAAFRNAVVHLLASIKADSRVAAIEQLQTRPHEAHALIGLAYP